MRSSRQKIGPHSKPRSPREAISCARLSPSLPAPRLERRRQMPKKRKPVHRPKPRKPATTAIVPVAPSETIVRRRELHFSREQIDLIKENVAKGTTDEQLQLFLYVCKKHRLDPLVKQVYCVLWPRDNGKFHDMVIITGINGFRSTAARDHKDFAGTSKP